MSQSDQKQKSQELYAVITGQVQGVGFRYFVVHEAQALGIRGYVRNTEQGDVQVVAQGERSTLEHLLILLRQGPAAAQVQEVHMEWRDPETFLSGFSIRW